MSSPHRWYSTTLAVFGLKHLGRLWKLVLFVHDKTWHVLKPFSRKPRINVFPPRRLYSSSVTVYGQLAGRIGVEWELLALRGLIVLVLATAIATVWYTISLSMPVRSVLMKSNTSSRKIGWHLTTAIVPGIESSGLYSLKNLKFWVATPTNYVRVGWGIRNLNSELSVFKWEKNRCQMTELAQKTVTASLEMFAWVVVRW